MARFKRLIAICLGLIAFLVVAALLALRFLPETEFIRTSVQDQLRRITGQQVSVGSISVSPSYTGAINLKVRGIAVASDQGKLLLSADELILSPEILPFLRKEISIESIMVQGLRTTVRRSSEGTLSAAFIPMPASSPASGGEPQAQPADKPEVASGSDRKPDGKVKWSIDSIILKNARIDWIDQQALPGQDVQLCLKNVSASLLRPKFDRKVNVVADAQLTSGSGKPTPVNIKGEVLPAEDLNGLEGANLEVSANSMSLRPFDVYLPGWVNSDLAVESATASLNWEKGTEPRIRVNTALKSETRTAAQLNVRAELSAAEDFSALETIGINAESDGVPISFLTAALPDKVPLDPRHGILKAAVQANWKRNRDWAATANLNLEDAVLTGKLKGMASKLKVWTQAKIEPRLLVIESMEISEASRIASIAGTVERPFSDERLLDLRGDLSFKPEWLKSLGFNVPKGLSIHGAIPVRGNVRGRPDNIWVDLKADLTAAGIEWLPHFEKTPGNRGTLAVKGRFLPFKDHKNEEPGIVSLGLAGVNLRLNPKGKWFPGKHVSVESKFFLKGNHVDLRDGTLALRRGSEPGDMFSVKADATDLGSPAPHFDGLATVNVDKEIVSLLAENESELSLKGNAPLKGKFTGTPAALTWSLAIPLTHLDIAVGESFRKPGGLAGAFKASGKLAGQELELTSAQLTFPGVVLNAKGKLRDRNGNFGEVNLDLAKSELKELVKLVPSAGDLRLSGPVEGTLVVKKPAADVIPEGTVRLIAVDYRPPNAGWSLERVKGLVEPSGTSVKIPELTGNLHGAIEAPVKLMGSLKDVKSVETLNGTVSLTMDSGRIRADRLRNTLDKVNLLIGTILNPQREVQQSKLLEFKSLTGDLHVSGGNVRTENVTLKGAEVNAGLMGSLRLNAMTLDLLAGIKTYTAAGNTLGKIPAVKELVKKHEGILKMTGLDKELKRLGIDGESSDPKNEGTERLAKTPVTVIVKVRGTASRPEVAPVLENTLTKETLSRLQSLMN